jgi:homoserine kinase
VSERISVRVPATSANLGCLFDCGAVALGLYLDVHVTPRADSEIAVRYQGVNPERIPGAADNLIAKIIREALDQYGNPRGFDLEISNQIPVGAGLGSSAAAIVSALVASHRLAGRALFDEEIVTLATRREGHPDNVAAAWHGGFTVAMQRAGRILSYSCPLPEPLGLALVTPDYALSTAEARKVLPENYSRADAVHNLQRAVVLTSQLFSGAAGLQRDFFEDRWHQPYRAHLMPGLAEVLALHHSDLLGVCLSGAGPSILAFTRGDAAGVAALIQKTLTEKQVSSCAHSVAPDNRGAKGWILKD